MDQSKAYLVALHCVNGLGPVRLKLLLDYFKDPKAVWLATAQELAATNIPKNALTNLLEKRSKLDPEENFRAILNSGIKVLSIFEPVYPELLKQIYDPPIIIYYVGTLPTSKRTIGVVGTRKITGYGQAVTEKITKELVGLGFTIVSGLARGVDTQAHKTTVDHEGQTIAVLGGGLKKIFPSENKELARQIAQGHGAVISEFAPEAESTPGNFPARNRIIAGLSLGVLVTEAAEDSGSLITARLAIEEGREVFAVPGPITSNQSSGTTQLMKQGARVVTSGEDILDVLGLEKVAPSALNSHSQGSENLSELEKKILESLEREQKHIDELCRETKKPTFEVSGVLIKMEIKGLIRNLGGGNYTKSF